jgi:hypothetical protein
MALFIPQAQKPGVFCSGLFFKDTIKPKSKGSFETNIFFTPSNNRFTFHGAREVFSFQKNTEIGPN